MSKEYILICWIPYLLMFIEKGLNEMVDVK